MSRRLRGSVLGLLMAAAVGLVVVAAISAEGRPISRSDTNDGGAWMVNRQAGQVAHLNRTTMEWTGSVRVEGLVFDVDQSPDVTVVHDQELLTASLVDAARQESSSPVTVPEGAVVRAAPGAVVVHDPAENAVWWFGSTAFVGVSDVSAAPPLFEGGDGSSLVVGLGGLVAFHDPAAGVVRWLGPDGSVPEPTELDAGPARLATLVGSTLVLVEETAPVATDGESSNPDGDAGDDPAGSDGVVWLVDGTTVQRFGVPAAWSVLQQPSPEGGEVIGMTVDGAIVGMDLADGEPVDRGRVEGSEPLAPIVHRGAVWSATVSPSPRLHWENRRMEDIEAAPESLRLRLVNGWVWVNDAADGGLWTIVDESTVLTLDEWTIAENLQDDTSEFEDEDTFILGPDGEETIDPEDQDCDDGANLAPRAEDDAAQTRVGRPVLVAVTANDSDANCDPLAVDPAGFGSLPAGVLVSVSADGSRVQVTPGDTPAGAFEFTYTVTDGRGERASATVKIEVFANEAASNADPVAERDDMAVRVGASRSINVLDNDTDPEGDRLVLDSVEAGDRAVSFNPDGLLRVSIPAETPVEAFELPYTISDGFGGTAVGVVVVDVLGEEANEPPVVLTDRIEVRAGEEGTIDVLANDVDPEGEALTATELEVLDGAPEPVLDEEGMFTIRTDQLGSFRYRYVVSDGVNEVPGRLRVDVISAPEDNQPPVAVTDEVTVAAGATRVVAVLENDTDPDGDVVNLVAWDRVEELDVEEVPGVGFRVQPTASSPARSVLRYWISDGFNEPVPGFMIVSVAGIAEGQPPVAVDDQVRLRAGTTSAVAVLSNDFDPDGGILTVVDPAEVEGATVRIGRDGQWLVIGVDAATVGELSIPYDIVDEQGNRSAAPATVTVTVVPADAPNNAPVARRDVARTYRGQPVDIDVIANDSDPDGDPIQVVAIATQPANGTVEPLGEGRFRYTPTGDFTGTDSFTYTLADGYAGGSLESTGEVRVGVVRRGLNDDVPENGPPAAVDDGTNLPPAIIGGEAVELRVLANDTDPDDDELSIVEVGEVTRGSVTEQPDGTILFAPPPSGEAGQVSFRYTITDGRGLTDSALVTVELLAVDEVIPQLPPEANDDTTSAVRPGDEVTVEVLANDDDPDGLRSELTVLPSPDGAYRVDGNRVVLVAGDTSSQVPYRIADADELEAEAVINVTVRENSPPIAPTIQVVAQYETPTEVDLRAGGVDDPDGDALTFELIGAATGGSVEVLETTDATMRVRFTPSLGSTEPGAFRYRVTDDNDSAAEGVVAVTIEGGPPENRPPTAAPVTVNLEAGVPQTVDLASFASDEDTDDIPEFAITQPTQGNVTASLEGTVLTVSAPRSLEPSTDSFTYTVSDGTDQATATVTVDVAAENFGPPTAANYSRVVDRGAGPIVVPVAADATPALPAELAEGGIRVVSIDSQEGVNASITGGGTTITFTPATGARTGRITYTINDAQGPEDGANTGSIDITVRDVPGPPTAVTIGAPTENEITVSWRPPADNGGSEITGYTVRLTGASTRTHEAGPLELSHTFTGLPDSSTFQITVVARNAVGSGIAAGPVDVETPATVAIPAVPVIDSFAGTARGVLTATWRPGARADEVEGYQIRLSGGEWRDTNDLEASFPGLPDDTLRTVEVRAVNRAGEGPSVAVTARTWGLPGPVTATGFTPGVWTWTASWGPPADSGGPPLAEVTYEAGPSAPNGHQFLSCPSSSSPSTSPAPFVGSFPWQSNWCVRAVNEVGEGPWVQIDGSPLRPVVDAAFSSVCPGGGTGCGEAAVSVQAQNLQPGSAFVASCSTGGQITMSVDGGGRASGQGCRGAWSTVEVSFDTGEHLVGRQSIAVTAPLPPLQFFRGFYPPASACQGQTEYGTIEPVLPGEVISYSSPDVANLPSHTATPLGRVYVVWPCPVESPATWRVTAVAEPSGRTLQFVVPIAGS